MSMMSAGPVAAEESFMLTLDGTPVLTGLHPTSNRIFEHRRHFLRECGNPYSGTRYRQARTAPPHSSIEVQLTAVTPGAAAQVVITTVPQSLATGVTSSLITVQLEDSSGLAVDAGSGGCYR